MARRNEGGGTGAAIRHPSQKRGRERFESILDAAERLLATTEPSEIGIHQLSAELGIPAASIYHFFPEPALVFRALAERYIEQIEALEDDEPGTPPVTWQDAQTRSFRRSRDYFNRHTAARKVILGSALSYDIRSRDFESDRVIAERGVERLGRRFILPDIPGIVDRFLEVIVISDALWSLSIHRHGLITEEMEEQARRARIAYARTFLPEYLHLRDPEDQGAVQPGASSLSS